MSPRHWIAWTAAAAAAVAGACDPNEDPPPKSRPQPAAAATPRAQGTVEALEEKLAELEQRIKDAREAVRTARETRDRAAVKLQQWEREGQALRRKLEAARRSGTRTWTDLEKAIDRAMVEIESTLGASEQAESES